MLDEIVARYSEPARRYHTLTHVQQVLDIVEELLPLVGLSEDDAGAVRLAALLHDVVYDPRAGPGENEEESAEWAVDRLASAGVPPPVVERTAALIRLTASHRAPRGDAAAAVLIDADLAILGAAPAAYDEYRDAIRAEYGWLSDDEFREGRRRVLEALTSAPSLYTVPRMRERFEFQARANLARELSELASF